MASRFLALTAGVLLAACTIPGSGSGGPPPMPGGVITVFAAASLQPAFGRIASRFAERKQTEIRFNFAGTQTLTAQLQQGASADVFASADTDHMTTLQKAGLVDGESEIFAHNRLEIAVAHGNPKGIHALADLARPGTVVVLADPSVPAGKYAQQALGKAGVTIHPKSLELQVTAVLSKVALGEADAGIVYVSDVTTSGQVDGVAIPDAYNVIATYPAAVLKGASNPSSARAFLDFLIAADAQELLQEAGFQVP